MGTFPRVYVDEPWDSIPAHQLFSEGKLNNPVLEGRTFNEEHFLAPRMVHLVSLSPFYKLFGTELIVGRIVSLIYAFATLCVLYKLFVLFRFSVFHSLLGVVLLCTNNIFFIFGRLIRPEIAVTLLGLSAFYFISRAVIEKRSLPLVYAGLFVGTGFYAHPAFFLFIPPIAISLYSEYRRESVSGSGLWQFVAACFLGLLPYVIYLVYQDASHNFAHLWAQISDRVVQKESSFWVQTFVDELTRYRQYFFFPYRSPIVLIELFFLVLSLGCKDRLSRFCQLVILTHILLLPIIIVVRNVRHLLPVMPFLVILIVNVIHKADLGSVRAFVSGFRTKNILEKVIAICLVILLACQVIGNPCVAYIRRVTGYETVLTEMRSSIPKHTRVWGSMMFWFGFTDCHYRTDFTFASDIYTFKPQYVITNDNDIWGTVSSFSGKAKREKTEVINSIEHYVHNYGRKIATIADMGYGAIRIWKVDTSLVPDWDPR